MIIEELVQKQSDSGDLPIRMVSPFVDKLPEDNLLDFKTVTKPADIFSKYSPKTVLMFSEEMMDLLKVWNLNQEVFGMSLLSVLDVPSAGYDGDYTENTTRAGKTTYHDLIGDLAEAYRREELMSEEGMTYLEKEKGRITKRSGNVKEVSEDDFDESEE